jgi:LCP family protein required for cell wall assembly
VSADRREPGHRGARYWRVPRRRRIWMGVVGWTLWTVVALVVSAFAGAYIYLDNTLDAAAPNTARAKAARAATKPVLPGKPVNVLLIGSDTRPAEGDPGRSDSLIFVRMDPQRDLISMLSFPRDLYVQIPGYGQDKINAAYSRGPETTIKTIESLTGQPVNEYVIIDFAGVARLVDEGGGVYLDIDRRYYNKNIGTAATNYADIDLQPGYQKLNGTDALSYVRYRHTDSDYSRIARQQQFLSELKRQTKQLGNLTNVTSFRKIFADNIEMSITEVPRFLSLLRLALEAPKDRIARVSIQGSSSMINGASVELADPSEIASKVALWLEPEFEKDATAAKPVDPSTVDVTVLNGSGRVLAAESVAQALATKRYRTSVGGNADNFDFSSSAVFYADGYREPARKISQLLGPDATIGALENGGGHGNEVVVVAGADWAGTLATPPKPQARPPADVVDTTSLVDTLRGLRSQTGNLELMAPLKLPTGSEIRIVRGYRMGDNGPPAVKIVGQIYVGGAPRYFGISMTTMRNPPIVGGETGVQKRGGREYRTFYDGRNLQRLAFRVGNTWYWVSNTLMNELSAKTMEAIAESMRPLNRAKLPKGASDTAVTVSTDASTP